MAKIHFITFANHKFTNAQKNLETKAITEGLADQVWSFSDILLRQLPFYYKHKDILSAERGCGYCLWKSYFINEVYRYIDRDDIILYLDAADTFSNALELREYLETTLKQYKAIFVPGDRPQIQYTKKECFERMQCDMAAFHNTTQLEAGIIAIRKYRMTEILSEWMMWCCQKEIIVDETNQEQYPQFIDNRYDQSILTNIIRMKSDPEILISNDLRKWITCNVN